MTQKKQRDNLSSHAVKLCCGVRLLANLLLLEDAIHYDSDCTVARNITSRAVTVECEVDSHKQCCHLRSEV